MTASDGGLHKLLIVGGGPAGIGVFVRAARTGFLPRLLDPNVHGTASDCELSERLGMRQKGCVIVHDGGGDTFGAGSLGKYIINSNTFARSLLSSVLDEKPDLDPPESIQNTFLEWTKTHDSTKALEATGNSPACLVDFGKFLQTVGSCLQKELARHADTSKCLLHTRATRVERLESGIYRVEVTQGDETSSLFTEHVVFAMGGKQELPVSIESNPSCKGKLFLSEECLREDGFSRLRDHLSLSESKKVCIVGGSHSAFSVAWLLLNKGRAKRGKSLQLSSAIANTIADRAPESSTKVDVVRCEAVPDNTQVPESSTSETPTPTQVDSAERVTTADVPSVPKPKASTPPLVFQPKDITILHRTPIRCYYMTRKDAEADGADGSRVDRTGCVNTFTGLREDSKNLYKDIKAGKECHVRLFQVNQHGCQNLTTKAYESASAIVWCCGYSSRMIPVVDEHGSEIKFHTENGVVKLDLHARLQVTLPTKTIVPATNLHGVGLGFSLQSHVDEMGTETRADGVTVYHRRGATLVLASLFGSEVFGSDSQTFEEMVDKNDRIAKKKKELQSAEPSLVERVKSRVSSNSSGGSAVASCPSPTAKPSCAVDGASVLRGSSSAIKPDKSSARLVPSKKTQPTDHQLAPPPTASMNNSVAFVSTHPPAKMLLQRRRSAEVLPPGPVSTSDESDTQRRRRVASRSGSGSVPKGKGVHGKAVFPNAVPVAVLSTSQ